VSQLCEVNRTLGCQALLQSDCPHHSRKHAHRQRRSNPLTCHFEEIRAGSAFTDFPEFVNQEDLIEPIEFGGTQ
jgi:hypothetical protein